MSFDPKAIKWTVTFVVIYIPLAIILLYMNTLCQKMKEEFIKPILSKFDLDLWFQCHSSDLKLYL